MANLALYRSPRGKHVHVLKPSGQASICPLGPNFADPRGMLTGTVDDVTCPICRQLLERGH